MERWCGREIAHKGTERERTQAGVTQRMEESLYVETDKDKYIEDNGVTKGQKESEIDKTKGRETERVRDRKTEKESERETGEE